MPVLLRCRPYGAWVCEVALFYKDDIPTGFKRFSRRIRFGWECRSQPPLIHPYQGGRRVRRKTEPTGPGVSESA